MKPVPPMVSNDRQSSAANSTKARLRDRRKCLGRDKLSPDRSCRDEERVVLVETKKIIESSLIFGGCSCGAGIRVLLQSTSAGLTSVGDQRLAIRAD